jgi:hypothetical protein
MHVFCLRGSDVLRHAICQAGSNTLRRARTPPCRAPRHPRRCCCQANCRRGLARRRRDGCARRRSEILDVLSHSCLRAVAAYIRPRPPPGVGRGRRRLARLERATYVDDVRAISIRSIGAWMPTARTHGRRGKSGSLVRASTSLNSHERERHR